MLPPGWLITRISSNSIPKGWLTFDNRGFEIEGKNVQHTFQTWIVPTDWVGIRQFGNLRNLYSDAIFQGQNFKAITESDDLSVHEAFRHGLHFNSPSIINGGWFAAENIFKNRLAEIDAQTQLLVKRSCKDQACQDEAAFSLIVLGVPARGVILQCAEHATQEARRACISALAYFGGKDSVRALSDAITDPSSSQDIQKSAAFSLWRLADPSSGPALLKALDVITWSEALYTTVEALERIRYEPAAPKILSLLKKEPLALSKRESSNRWYYIKALASLRYKPAIPEIERFCKPQKYSADWFIRQEQQFPESQWFRPAGVSLEIELLRLTASWGTPSRGIRLLLLPPDGFSTQGPTRIVVMIENCGDRDLDVLGPGGGTVIVDGQRYEDRLPMVFIGSTALRPNEVAARIIDLSRFTTCGRTHRVGYQYGRGNSNEATLFRPCNPNGFNRW